jgi:hypothetical protein
VQEFIFCALPKLIMIFSPSGPDESDTSLITCEKWLQAIRAAFMQTDSDTFPSIHDQMNDVLHKILTVYLRAA